MKIFKLYFITILFAFFSINCFADDDNDNISYNFIKINNNFVLEKQEKEFINDRKEKISLILVENINNILNEQNIITNDISPILIKNGLSNSKKEGLLTFEINNVVKILDNSFITAIVNYNKKFVKIYKINILKQNDNLKIEFIKL